MKLITDKIIEDITSSLGLRFFSKEKRDEILTEVLEVISKKAGIRIVEKFSDGETEEFNKISKDNLEKMEEFMIAKNPEAGKIFEEEAEKVKEELLNAKVVK
jgi:hypothetical protein